MVTTMSSYHPFPHRTFFLTVTWSSLECSDHGLQVCLHLPYTYVYNCCPPNLRHISSCSLTPSPACLMGNSKPAWLTEGPHRLCTWPLTLTSCVSPNEWHSSNPVTHADIHPTHSSSSTSHSTSYKTYQFSSLNLTRVCFLLSVFTCLSIFIFSLQLYLPSPICLFTKYLLSINHLY